MGRTPTDAILRCFKLSDAGLLDIEVEGWVFITQKGLDLLEKEDNNQNEK